MIFILQYTYVVYNLSRDLIYDLKQNFALEVHELNKRKCNGLNVTNVHVGCINTA